MHVTEAGTDALWSAQTHVCIGCASTNVSCRCGMAVTHGRLCSLQHLRKLAPGISRVEGSSAAKFVIRGASEARTVILLLDWGLPKDGSSPGQTPIKLVSMEIKALCKGRRFAWLFNVNSSFIPAFCMLG